MNKKERRKRNRQQLQRGVQDNHEEPQQVPQTNAESTNVTDGCTPEVSSKLVDQEVQDKNDAENEVTATVQTERDFNVERNSLTVVNDDVEIQEPISDSPLPSPMSHHPRRRLEIKSAIPLQTFRDFQLVPLKKRPSGTLGQPTKVYCNHFPVTLKDNVALYQYDVLVEKHNPRHRCPWEEVMRRDQRRRFVQKLDEMKQFNFSYWYDEGKIFYTTKRLNEKEFPRLFQLPVGSEYCEYRLAIISLANQWSTSTIFNYLKSTDCESPNNAVRILETLLKQALLPIAHCEGSLFYRNEKKPDFSVGDGFELRLGFFQALCVTQAGLTLNLQTTLTKFYPFCDVLDFLQVHLRKDIRRHGMTSSDYEKAKLALNGCKITTRQSNYTQIYKIRGFSEIPERQRIELSTIQNHHDQQREDRGEITLVEYYRTEKSIQLIHPKLRCLQCYFLHDSRDAKHIPIELCRILEWQECERESSSQQRERQNLSIPTPDRRYQNIMESLHLCSYKNPPVLPLCKEVMLSVDDREMKCINARILPQPTINDNHAEIKVGRINLRGRFMAPIKIDSISFAYFSKLKPPLPQEEITLLGKFIDSFNKVSKQYNMGPIRVVRKDIRTISDNDQLRDENLRTIQTYFEQKKNENCQLVVCIMNSTWNELRPTIKLNGTVTYGIATQCVMRSKLQEQIDKFNRHPRGSPDRILDNMCENLLRKINFKMQGTNTEVSLPTEIRSQMRPGVRPSADLWQFMGADVIHPVCRQDKPSIAAVVGSGDSLCSTSAVRVCKQWPKTGKCAIEAIVDLKQMTVELLEFYRESNNGLPNKVVFYRDGVDDGQFSRVLNFEIPQLKDAFQEVYQNETPPLLTFIVVKKRHHTRFFMLDERDQTINIPPGLVVDTDIVHPGQFSFFLNSHKALQGTNRPALYHVLYDEINFTADELELLTYNLCFTDPRSSTSEAIPSLIHQADLAASNARDLFPETDASTNDGYAQDALEDPGLNDIVTEHLRVHEDMRDTPHFG